MKIKSNIWKSLLLPVVMAESKNKGDDKVKVERSFLKPSQLPLYEEEEKLEYHMDEPSRLFEGFSVIVKEMQGLRSQTKTFTDDVNRIYETGKAHSMTSINYILEEENVTARAGVIGAGGLVGLLLSLRKKSLIKKLLYTGIGAGAISAALYPSTAYDLSMQAYTEGEKYANIGYNFVAGVKPSEENIVANGSKKEATIPGIKPVENEKKNISSKEAPNPKQTDQQKTKIVSKVAGDVGQSNPADKDMYTTRS